MSKDGQIIEHLTSKEKIGLGAGIPAVVITLYALWDRNYVRTTVIKNRAIISTYAQKLMRDGLSEQVAYGKAVNEFISYINDFRNLFEPNLAYIEANGYQLMKVSAESKMLPKPSNPINYIWNKRYGNLSQELIDKEGTLDEPLLTALEEAV